MRRICLGISVSTDLPKSMFNCLPVSVSVVVPCTCFSRWWGLLFAGSGGIFHDFSIFSCGSKISCASQVLRRCRPLLAVVFFIFVCFSNFFSFIYLPIRWRCSPFRGGGLFSLFFICLPDSLREWRAGGGPYCSRPFFPLMLAALVQTCPNDQIDC